MGSVVPLKKEINNSYFELKNMLEDRLNNVNQLIKHKLASEINLIHKMTSNDKCGKATRGFLADF